MNKNNMNKYGLLVSLFLVVFILNGCATTQGNTKNEKRQSILSMKDEVLTELFKLKPDVRSQITQASGYAVFSNV
ncbi:MAG: hypothetical protein L3J46_01180, partial [Kangiellaceae bacterium]|nr:hypothetical protein [Kangiellaceae bacterium]